MTQNIGCIETIITNECLLQNFVFPRCYLEVYEVDEVDCIESLTIAYETKIDILKEMR